MCFESKKIPNQVKPATRTSIPLQSPHNARRTLDFPKGIKQFPRNEDSGKTRWHPRNVEVPSDRRIHGAGRGYKEQMHVCRCAHNGIRFLICSVVSLTVEWLNAAMLAGAYVTCALGCHTRLPHTSWSSCTVVFSWVDSAPGGRFHIVVKSQPSR